MALGEVHGTPSRPWSERLADASRWPPFGVALVVGTGLVATFLLLSFAIGRLPLLFSGEAPLAVREDVRIGILLTLIAVYVPAAWISGVRSARRNVRALLPFLPGGQAERSAWLESAGRYGTRNLRMAGVLGITVGIGIQLFTDWGDTPALLMLGVPFETYWHRLMLFTVAWFAGRGVLATVIEAHRFSRIGRELRIDLLDPTPQRVLTRQSLHTTLLVIGALSLILFMFYDVAAAPQLAWTLTGVGVASVSLAGLALGLPLRGLHDSVAEAKRRELAWCDDAIRNARRALVDDAASTDAGRLADLVAYRSVIESVREWPLDAPALRRFALYCVIPLASWLGGAVVEHVVDALLG